LYCLCEHFFTDYFSFFFPIFTWTVHFLGIFTWIVKFVFHFLQFFFVFIYFLHYLHEESFSFLHCFYYCVTIHMNSEPFFTIHIIFFLLLQLMSLFKWIVHLFSIFFHYSHDQCNFQNCLHGENFFIFFPAIVLHYSHQQSILVKKFQHYSHSWTNSSNNDLACCMYIKKKLKLLSVSLCKSTVKRWAVLFFYYYYYYFSLFFCFYFFPIFFVFFFFFFSFCFFCFYFLFICFPFFSVFIFYFFLFSFFFWFSIAFMGFFLLFSLCIFLLMNFFLFNLVC
jgi:hypothetical protein